jgi:uncharacterized protein YqeY
MNEMEIESAVRSISSDLIGVVTNIQALKGKVMGEFNKQYNGRADMNLVKPIIERILGK